MARHHAVAWDQLLVHPEIAAAVGYQLVDLNEGAGVEEEIDALARGQLARVVLPLAAARATTLLGAAFVVGEGGASVHHALRACAFSQSARNFASPISVSGWLKRLSITLGGQVQMSAPIRAASTTWIGPRMLATSSSVPNS